MNSLAVLIAVLALVPQPRKTVETGVRKLVWMDEFDGSSLDAKRWNRCETGTSDWNLHMSTRKDLVEVKNGELVLWGVANEDKKSDPRPFLTGGVQSKGKGLMGIGKVEMRVKFEDHQKGAWPALWMCGENLGVQGRRWPWNGEIDIVFPCIQCIPWLCNYPGLSRLKPQT